MHMHVAPMVCRSFPPVHILIHVQLFIFLHFFSVSQEPEVVDLAEFLTSCGAHIKGAGTNTLSIQGSPSLTTPTDFAIIPDRIETGTFLVAAAATRSTISLSPVVPRHLTAVICKLREMGCLVQQTHVDSLTVSLLTLPSPL